MDKTERDLKVKKRRADMPVTCRGIYDKAMSGKSRGAAIKSFCYECMGWSRKEVRLCTSYACPLWLYRPKKSRSAQEPLPSVPESTNSTQPVPK